MAIDFDLARDYHGNLEWLPKRTILLTLGGSHSYGLNTPESDVDIKGIAIPPREYFLGWLKRFEQAESHDLDLTIFDIRKFFALAAEANPNVLETLYTEEEDIIHISDAGRVLRKNRDLFLSQKVKHTFSGYAASQAHRIRRHRAWLLSPPTHKPTREEYGLPETSVLPKDIIGAIQSLENQEKLDVHLEEFGPMVMEAYQRERSYHNAMRGWTQYENWKQNRNPKRAAMEKEFGFDLKHASHLVRLLRMGEEILATGKVLVKRPDRKEILAIRNGAWTYDQITEYADMMDARLTELMAASPLPKSPDRVALDRLCVELVSDALK